MDANTKLAWDYMLDMMSARFASGDIGIESHSPAGDDHVGDVCAAGEKIIAALRRDGCPLA